jgi:hypothetical protein
MMRKLLIAASLVAMSSAALGQQKQEPPPSLTDVTGVWIMLVEGHQIGLELEQKGTTVEGVMHAMGTRQLLKGTYVERALTLVGEKMEGAPDGPHGNPHAGPIEARMLDDGTLEGELSTNRGRRKWTGERLQKR